MRLPRDGVTAVWDALVAVVGWMTWPTRLSPVYTLQALPLPRPVGPVRH